MFDKDKHIVNVEKLLTDKEIVFTDAKYVSIDYGTQNPTTFLLWQRDTNKNWYCVKEYYYSGRDKGIQKTDLEYAHDLKEWLGVNNIKIIVDPAAASFITQLRRFGFTVIKAKNDVLDGIRLVATLLTGMKIFLDESCTSTIKEFGSYVWDKKAAEKGEDKPIKEHDHAMDAIRYFCMTILNPATKIRVSDKSKLGL